MPTHKTVAMGPFNFNATMSIMVLRPLRPWALIMPATKQLKLLRHPKQVDAHKNVNDGRRLAAASPARQSGPSERKWWMRTDRNSERSEPSNVTDFIHLRFEINRFRSSNWFECIEPSTDRIFIHDIFGSFSRALPAIKCVKMSCVHAYKLRAEHRIVPFLLGKRKKQREAKSERTNWGKGERHESGSASLGVDHQSNGGTSAEQKPLKCSQRAERSSPATTIKIETTIDRSLVASCAHCAAKESAFLPEKARRKADGKSN